MLFSKRAEVNSFNAVSFGAFAFFAMCGLVFISLSSDAKAQMLTTTASNGSVAADVWNGSGFIDIYVPDGNNKDRLSFSKFSFLTVQVGNGFYTNNSNLFTSAQPAPPTQVLLNGTNLLIKDKAKLGNDTIRTTWQISNSFQIIQDVFPVIFEFGGGQIVYKISIKNLQNSALNAQAQFLLDNEISTNNPPFGNDNDTLATRAGYSPNWITFPNADYEGIPPFELAFEHGLCGAGPFPGTIAIGYTNDSLAPEPMGLMVPETYTFVDNQNSIAQNWTWGFPQSLIGSSYSDAATLIQWPASGAGPAGGSSEEQEIACGSYGVQQCPTCFGNLDGMILHPEHIRWNNPGYSPQPFPVEAIIFNPNSANSANTANGTQSTLGPIVNLCPVKIASPQPTTNFGQTQMHSLNPGTIQSCNLSDIIWYDSIDNSLINCSTDLSYSIHVAVSAGGIARPIFFDSCICPIEVDCQEKDVTCPRFTATKTGTMGGYDTASFGVLDNGPTDLGIKTITYIVDSSGPPACVNVSIGHINSPCDNADTVRVFAKQIDSTCSACIYFLATDCAGNYCTDSICFPAHVLQGHPDLPPVFVFQNNYNWNYLNDTLQAGLCDAKTTVLNVTDSIIGDLGLVTIKIDSNLNGNMLLTLPTFVKGARTIDSIVVSVIDSNQNGYIILEAIDDSNHVAYDTISYCTVPDKHSPFLNSGSPIPGVLWPVTVWDSTSVKWDRGVDSVLLTNVQNCVPTQIAGNPISITVLDADSTTYSLRPIPMCTQIFMFDMDIVDSFKRASWTGQVWDCAGNTTIPLPNVITPDSDSFCPHYTVTSLTNPPGLHVVLDDIHLDQNGDTIHYDLGIQSVTFCSDSESDMTLTYNGQTDTTQNNSLPQINESPIGTVGNKSKYPEVISFDLTVTDTTRQDLSSACVCFDAVDGAGNSLCEGKYEWCYPLAHDTHPPTISVVPAVCDTLSLTVTDSLLNDQGIHGVWLTNNTNFNPLDTTLASNPRSFDLTLTKVNPVKSSFAQLSSIDEFGQNSGNPSDKITHTDSTDVWMYSQDLSMNTDRAATVAGNYTVPIYLIPTDSIPLSKKHIDAFQFTFHLTGSDSIIFIKPAPGLAGWTYNSVVNGPRSYTVTGHGNPALADGAISNVNPLLNLVFNADPDSVVGITNIVIDPDQCNAYVIYNNGNDTTVNGQNYSVTLPAPTGQLNGGTIFLQGKCTPVLTSGGNPSIISLSPTIPNPAANSTLVVYTVPTDAPVALELYNALGEKVRTLVSGFEKQGDYRMQLDASGLPDGTYFLRLASGGQVVSRKVDLSH